MKKLTLTILIALSLAPLLIAEESPPSFIIATHTITTTHTNKPLLVTFKLDSSSGDIWRLHDDSFIQIPVEAPTPQDLTKRIAQEEDRRTRTTLLKQMESTVIPEITFKQVPLVDAIEYLHNVSREHDPKQQGINFVLALDEWGTSDDWEDAEDPDNDEITENDDASTRITFTARYITLMDTLQLIMKMAGVRYQFQNNSVVITSLGGCISSMQRTYDISGPTVKQMTSFLTQPTPSNLPPRSANEKLMDAFAVFGVEWPRGSSLTLFPFAGLITASNTPDNIEVFEQAMQHIEKFQLWPNRFRLLTPHLNSSSSLLLFDSHTGYTWRYQIHDIDKHTLRVQSDKFLTIPHCKQDAQQAPASDLPKTATEE